MSNGSGVTLSHEDIQKGRCVCVMAKWLNDCSWSSLSFQPSPKCVGHFIINAAALHFCTLNFEVLKDQMWILLLQIKPTEVLDEMFMSWWTGGLSGLNDIQNSLTFTSLLVPSGMKLISLIRSGVYLRFPSCAPRSFVFNPLSFVFSRHNRKIPKAGAKRDHR